MCNDVKAVYNKEVASVYKQRVFPCTSTLTTVFEKEGSDFLDRKIKKCRRIVLGIGVFVMTAVFTGCAGEQDPKDSGDASADDGKRERICEVDEM